MQYERTRSLARTAVIVLPLGFAIGCGSDQPAEPVESPSAAQVERQARELFETAADYGRGQQRILERRAEESLAELDRGIDELEAELAETTDEGRARLEQALERAERARDTIRSEVEDLREVAEDRWERAGRRISAAVEEAREARREIGRALTGSEPDTPEQQS